MFITLMGGISLIKDYYTVVLIEWFNILFNININ